VSEMKRNFLVGLVTILAVVGFTILLFMFGELDRFVNPRYPVRLYTDHAAGLRSGSAVELNGVPIGIIDVIATRADATMPVEVIMMIDSTVEIPANVHTYALASLLGGSSILELEVPRMAVDQGVLPRDGTATLSGPLGSRLIEELTAELDARTAPLLDALAQFNELSATYSELGRNINALVAPRTDEELAAGASPTVATAMRKFDLILDDTREALRLARSWLGDEQLRENVRLAIEKSVTLVEQSTQAVDEIARVAGSIEAQTATLTEKLVPVSDELASTLTEVRGLAKRAAEGDGTIPMLLNNPDLYLSLQDATVRLEQTLRELQLLIQKIEAEGVPLNL